MLNVFFFLLSDIDIFIFYYYF